MDFSNRKQFRHKAEIPLVIISVITSIGLLCFVVWCLIQIPNNPDFKQFLVDFFGFSKDSIDGLIKFGGFAFDILVIFMILHIIFEFIDFYGKTASFEVKLSKIQMPEVYKICEKYAEKLYLKNIPILYFYTSGKPAEGIMGVPISTFIIRINSNNAKSYYDVPSFKPALQFLIARDLGHIYLGHADAWHVFATFFARMIPIYGQMYNRVLNYSADKVAAALVGENASEALAMSVVKPKNTTYLSTKDLFNDKTARSSKFEKTSIWFNNLLSKESPVIYRKEAIEKNISGKLF